MPANNRIVEKFNGLNEETGLESWERIFDLSVLNVEDRIRIYEDAIAKKDDNRMLDGYLLKKPIIDCRIRDTLSFDIETVATREARLAAEAMEKMKQPKAQETEKE